MCDQCGATFSSEDALEAHRQTHTGILQTRMHALTLLTHAHTHVQAVTTGLVIVGLNLLVMLAGLNCSCHDAP